MTLRIVITSCSSQLVHLFAHLALSKSEYQLRGSMLTVAAGVVVIWDVLVDVDGERRRGRAAGDAASQVVRHCGNVLAEVNTAIPIAMDFDQ